jgi:hypothetical protein
MNENSPQPQQPAQKKKVSVLLGHVVATTEARAQIPNAEILRALDRHQSGDWGELSKFDQKANDKALVDGSRLLSAYKSSAGVKFWIITEADRSSTCVLLPEEY